MFAYENWWFKHIVFGGNVLSILVLTSMTSMSGAQIANNCVLRETIVYTFFCAKVTGFRVLGGERFCFYCFLALVLTLHYNNFKLSYPSQPQICGLSNVKCTDRIKQWK